MDHVHNMQTAIDEFNSNNFLITKEKKTEVLVNSCVDFLESFGFYVRWPIRKTAVISNRTLVTCYYNYLFNTVPDILPVMDEIKDLTTAKHLIERLMVDFDLKKEQAFSMAENMVIVLLHNWEIYGIDKGLLCSFSVFGQGKLKFITDRVISTLNSSKYNDELSIIMADGWAQAYLNENGKELGYI